MRQDKLEQSILRGKQRLHFIGIGGSGMFPIVQILHKQGYSISGSDNNEGDTLQMVREMGIPVSLGHREENVKGADLVVYTAAVFQDNCELAYAREHGIPTAERAEVLGLLSECFDNAVCISGTHGKTTTTAMLTSILLECGADPSAVIGGKLPQINGSGRVGDSDIFVCEACEFKDTFLHLSPDIGVILNVDADHLEYFHTLDNIIRSFHQFGLNTSKCVIANGDDASTEKAVEGLAVPVVTFGKGETCTYRAVNIALHDGVCCSYDLLYKGELSAQIQLNIPGSHNVLNSLAAVAAAHVLGIPFGDIEKAVPAFRGANRRFEILGRINGVVVADDYAHHPAELSATLKTAKEMSFRRVWAVFQPVTYSRTALLLDDFSAALSIADKVVLAEIMGAREHNTYHIYSKDLADKVEGSVWFPTFEEIAAYVLANAGEGDLVLTLGCGDIYKCAKLILKG